ncbi:MAG: YfiR family protein [Thermoanaerobaculia bacterium]|nr:YfiR family protein [Thermoanaerobaculia bacterium]
MTFSRCRRRAALGLILLAVLARPVALRGSRIPQKAGVSVSALKAEIVERFSRFVRWPDEARPADGMPFVLCVIGSSPLRQTLPDAARGRIVDQHPTRVLYVDAQQGFGSCHVLFIGRLEVEDLEETLEAVRGKPILTVADTAGLAEAGVMINLFVEEGRIGFEVNEASAAESRLELTAALLRLARPLEAEVPET